MTIDWNAVAAIGAVLSVIVALIALWRQVQDLKQSIQSGTYQEIVRMFDEFSRLMVDQPALGQIIFARDATALDAEQEFRIDWVLAIRFDWFESVVIQQRKYKAIPQDIYDHWLGVLTTELKYPVIRQYWEKCHTYYHPLLQQEVGARFPPLPSPPAPSTSASHHEPPADAR